MGSSSSQSKIPGKDELWRPFITCVGYRFTTRYDFPSEYCAQPIGATNMKYNMTISGRDHPNYYAKLIKYASDEMIVGFCKSLLFEMFSDKIKEVSLVKVSEFRGQKTFHLNLTLV